MKLLVIFLLIIVAIAVAVKINNDCNNKGGQLMKNLYGVYVCAKAIEVEE